MTFDMRNWHLMGGVQSIGIIKPKSKKRKLIADGEYPSSTLSWGNPDSTCQKCGFVECKCKITPEIFEKMKDISDAFKKAAKVFKKTGNPCNEIDIKRHRDPTRYETEYSHGIPNKNDGVIRSLESH